MQHIFRFSFLFLTCLLCSCWSSRTVKQVSWRDYEFKLISSDGGATTAFLHKVTVLRKGTWGTSEDELFQAYGGPSVTDIHVEDGTLVLTGAKTNETIELDLKQLNYFIDEPVKYHRFALEQTNAAYQEPAYVVANREIEATIDLDTQRRREERERATK